MALLMIVNVKRGFPQICGVKTTTAVHGVLPSGFLTGPMINLALQSLLIKVV